MHGGAADRPVPQPLPAYVTAETAKNLYNNCVKKLFIIEGKARVGELFWDADVQVRCSLFWAAIAASYGKVVALFTSKRGIELEPPSNFPVSSLFLPSQNCDGWMPGSTCRCRGAPSERSAKQGASGVVVLGTEPTAVAGEEGGGGTNADELAPVEVGTGTGALPQPQPGTQSCDSGAAAGPSVREILKLPDGVTCWNPTKFTDVQNPAQMAKVQKFIEGYCTVLGIPNPAMAKDVTLEVYIPPRRSTAKVMQIQSHARR